MINLMITIFLLGLACIVIYMYLSAPSINSKLAESFNSDNPLEVLIFLSKTCPHCVQYIKNEDKHITAYIENEKKGKIKKIFPDEDPDNLFSKYDVQYVPTIVINNKVVNMRPTIKDFYNIEKFINVK